MQLEDSKYAKKENDLKVVKKAVIRVIERCLVEPTVVFRCEALRSLCTSLPNKRISGLN